MGSVVHLDSPQQHIMHFIAVMLDTAEDVLDFGDLHMVPCFYELPADGAMAWITLLRCAGFGNVNFWMETARGLVMLFDSMSQVELAI